MTSMELAWIIRRHGVEMTHISGGSHIGSVMSVADIMGVLYADILRFRSEEPRWKDRDRFILSKGHAAAALYAALAECGFFPVEELLTFYANASRLSGHVSHKVPGVEFSTGSLGHGLGVALGMAIAAKQDGRTHRVFTVLGDGECNEGSVWEAAQAAAHYGLNHLIAIIDCNKMQSLDYCDRTLYSGSPADKWRSFGWHVEEVNGHDHEQLRKALANIDPNRPTVVIAHTRKGFPISFMEQDILWHYRFPHDGWEYDGAVHALHRCKPESVEDPYTPRGTAESEKQKEDSGDHTMCATYHPDWYELREVTP